MCNDGNIDSLVDVEYQIQHFGFSAKEVIDQYREVLMDTIKSVCESMEKCTISKLSLSDEKKEILHSEMITLQQRYAESVTECVKKYEQDIKNFFSIPKHVTVMIDQVHSANTSKQDLTSLQNEIDTLEKEYLKEKMLKALYEQELEMCIKIEPYMRQSQTLCKRIDKYQSLLEEIATIDKLSENYSSITDQYNEDFNVSDWQRETEQYGEGFAKNPEMEPWQ